jgi:hypothetical protein
MPKYGEIWTYYRDTNIYNYLVKDPAGPAALNALTSAKQQRKAYTYASMFNIEELAATYPSDPALAVRLLETLRMLVDRSGVRGTPELLRAEIRHLRDHSVRMELFESRDSEYTREYFRVVGRARRQRGSRGCGKEAVEGNGTSGSEPGVPGP